MPQMSTSSDIFTFDSLLMRSESLIEKDECNQLLGYFEVPDKESKDIIKSDEPFSSLVHHLREAAKISFDDINYLITACSDKGLSKLVTVLNVYQQAQDSKFYKKLEDKRLELSHKRTEAEDERQQLTGKLKITDEEIQHVKDTLATTEEERQTLSEKLKTTEKEKEQLKCTLTITEEERQQLSERLKITKDGIHQFKEKLAATEEERQQFIDALKATEKERQQFKDILKATVEERQQLSERLKTTEKERQQFKNTLKATEEERQHLKDTLKTTEENRQQLSERLKTTEEERQQFKDTLTATEEGRQQIIDALKAAEEERQQFKDTLEVTEEERQQLSERLKTTEKERQQFKNTLKATEEERQHLKDTLKKTEENRQQLSERLKTTEEERQQFKDTLTATEEGRQQIIDALKAAEEERQQFKDTLEVTEEERQQLGERLTTTEKERQQFKHNLKATEEQKQQLSERLKATEEERQQNKDTLEATEEEIQQLSEKIMTAEEERQQLKDTLKATEEEKQQLSERLKTTEKERQQIKDTMKSTEEESQQLSERLNTAEEESQQFKDTLEATEEEIQHLSERVKTTEEKRQQFKDTLKATEEERQQLSGRLKKTEEESKQFKDASEATDKDLRHKLNTVENTPKTLKDEKEELLQQQKEELEEAKSILRATKDELLKSQLEYAIESMALQEVLKHTRKSLNQQELAPHASVTAEETLLEECEAPDVSPESTLAADYGRLMVKVAEDLTLDSTLKLATLFGLPPAETDMLRRVSLIETPGITLINFMKTRNIINMYDVTNLQKGLVYIQLNKTNEYLLSPYQYKVDSFQFEEKRLPELLDWPVENVKSLPDDGSTPSQASEEREEYYDRSKESLTEIEHLTTQRKASKEIEIRHHHSYIEHRIKCEGGTISIMGVHLTIPEDALSCEGVISVKVIYDPDIHLPGSARRGRMTPLIKLEPEGLALNKPAQLIIPHSAIIPEPDRHDVSIFTGLKDEECLLEGEITWTEEKCVHRKLDPDMISLDINILSYVFVNLVSQETEQKHIFRIVPFIDGILDAKDDVLITVCFCKDSDEEYKLLLEDHQSKLSLGNYTTFQVTRTLNDSRDYASYIDLMMSLPVDSYHLMQEESTKHVDIDHLCAASRVSHQFRLQRNNDGHTDMVDVKLTVSQHEKNQIALILQSKMKNIMLSPESRKLLFRELPSDVHQFEKLKRDIAKLLDKQHCGKLGMFFELEPAENDTIQEAAESGKMLMKILDERELIMPDRMIGLYEGLKAIHFNKVARLVLAYIDTLQEKHGQENEGQKDDKKMVKVSEKQEVISKRKPQLSINLIKEGYKRRDVQSALSLSRGKLDLGRRILLLAREEHERLNLFPGSNLYKEQYFDKHGGEVVIAGVNLIVPAGALHTGRIVSLWVSTDPAINGPISKKSLRLTPFVKFGPESLTLHKPVTLIIPHCALTTTNQMSIDVYSGVTQTDKSVKWILERKHLNCSLKSQQLAVKAQQPCLIGLHVPFIPKLRKRVCILPIVNRVSDSGDQLTIHVWFHNDDTLEHESLINEEIYQKRGTMIHDPVSVLLKSMTSTLHVSTNSSTSQCNPHPRKV
ncbi:putative kinesin-like protein, partial [Apostichopus japonicus]